mgnify:CR=1 FL=1
MFARGPIIKDQELILRPLRLRDRSVWNQVRRINRDWLNPWEATRPHIDGDGPLPNYAQMIHFHNQELKAGRSYSMALWILEAGRERFIGQVTLGGIVMGAYRGGYIGYWIDQRFAGRGYTTRAVIALTDFAFERLQLHRIEINLRPENEASRKVAEKAGYTFEGLRPRYLHINGDWRDHSTYVIENPNI